MEKIFKFLGCTDSQKVNYATYMFEGPTKIWCYNDAHELLTGNMGSNKIRGIMLRSPKPIKVSLKSKVFKRMKNLKFLMGDVHIDKELDYQPHELRFLEWNVSPLSLSSKCLPPRQLVALKMSSFIVENVFKQEFQYKNLKSISLSRCDSITKVPDLCAPNLETLEILGCINLIEVHESIGFLDKLKLWKILICRKLEILPSKLIFLGLRLHLFPLIPTSLALPHVWDQRAFNNVEEDSRLSMETTALMGLKAMI